MNHLLEGSEVGEAIHFFLFDAGFAAGVGGDLHVEEDGDDLVAEALLGEAAHGKVTLVEQGVLLLESLDEAIVNQVNQFHIIVPILRIEVEVKGGGGDLLRQGQGRQIDFVFAHGRFQLVFGLLGLEFAFEGTLAQEQKGEEEEQEQKR